MDGARRWPTVLVVVAAVVVIAVQARPGKARAQDAQVAALRLLEADAVRPPLVHLERGIPRFVEAEVPLPVVVADDPVAQSLYALERYRDLYRLDDPERQLHLERIVTDASGDQHVFFGQQRDGIPVFGAEIAIHLDRPGGVHELSGGTSVIATNGNYLPEIPLLAPAAIGAEMAREIAATSVPGTGAAAVGEPRLMYVDGRLFGGFPGAPGGGDEGGAGAGTHLAWRVVVRGLRTSDAMGTSWLVFIDAHSGALVGVLDRSPSHAADKDFDIQTVNNTTSSSCWMWVTDDDQWFDENGPTTSVDADGWNAFNFAHQTYDFFFNNFHCHSWDCTEHDLDVMVHVGTNWQNASYDPGCDHLKFGDGYPVLDIFAHEHTHAITGHSSKLVYANQSGALNESYSDVMGAMVDSANWTIGENLTTGAARDMANPPTFGHPDHMSNYLTTTADHGGVHTNSSITNKAAFLIAQGGTHHGITVNGIGRTKTQLLYFYVLRLMLTANAQLVDARNASVTLARFYVKSKLLGFTVSDLCQVINGFAAVGLGVRDQDCDGLDDSEDSDDDGDYVGDSYDNCLNLANPGQEDNDNDGQGDACDADDDNDGVPDATDNCRLVVNPGQADDDHDGVGELCDDNDFDGKVNAADNCRDAYNPGQEDDDGDGVGTACDADNDNDGVPDNGDGTVWIGDNRCTAGQTANCDDNCRWVANPNQADADGDAWGDACDKCPGMANASDNADTDSDGQGDACDSDDDNDGILDDGDGSDTIGDHPCESFHTTSCDDNCRTVGNPAQADWNHDGQGNACDTDDIVQPAGWHGEIKFLHTDQPLRVPIVPCQSCPDWMPEKYATIIRLALPIDLPARIVDDAGDAVARAGAGLTKTLRFAVAADFSYRFPGGLPESGRGGAAGPARRRDTGGDVFRGRSYFLELLPTPEVVLGQLYSVTIDVQSEAAEVCGNGLDDDGDFLLDCEDPDCSGEPVCVESLCEDCVDEDADFLADRDDADCPARAQGAGRGLGDPTGRGKAAAACQAAIGKSASLFVKKKLAGLQRCADAVFACLQTQPGDAGCLAAASAKCASERARLTDPERGEEAKLLRTIEGACGALPVDDLLAAPGLGFAAEEAACEALGVAPLGLPGDVAQCVLRRHECRVEQILARQVPRLRELLALGDIPPATFACVPVGAVGSGRGLGDPAHRGKAAAACQAAIKRAGRTFVGKELAALRKCADAVFKCVETRPGDLGCLVLARFRCAREQARRIDPQRGLEAKLLQTLVKGCPVAPEELLPSTGLGFAAEQGACAGLGVAGLDSPADVARCLSAHHRCLVGQLLDAAMPRARELLAIGGIDQP